MKKFKTFAYRGIQIVLILCSCTSCKKFIDEGITTKLTGMVSDPISHKTISSASIYVYEYVSGAFGPKFSKITDSTKCDINGNFSISFTTTGKALEYRLMCFTLKDYYSQQDPVKISVGKDSSINFTAIKTRLLKARVIVSNNINPPLRVYSNIGTGGNISGRSGDSTIFLRILPNLSNYIYFNITNIDTPKKSNVRIDTIIFSGVTDTFSHTFQVNPQLFKKRL